MSCDDGMCWADSLGKACEFWKGEAFELQDALLWALTWIDYCDERPLPEPMTEEVEDWKKWQAAMDLVGYPENEPEPDGEKSARDHG